MKLFKLIRAGAVCLLALAGNTGAAEVPNPAVRGYTVPVLDVSGDITRRVIVDRRPGQYLGHPTTVLLKDGRTIFAVYPLGHAAGALVLVKSTDGGLSWSAPLPVPENWSTSKNPPSIHRVVAPDGRERLIILTGSAENTKEDLPVRLTVSDDEGKTWSPLRPIGEGRDYNAIVAASSMLRLKDGRYMALHHSDYLPGVDGKRNMKLYKMLSGDGGLTWSKRIFVAEHPVAEFCEPGAVRSPSGDEIAVMIRDNSRLFHSFVVFSSDEGEKWSKARQLPGPLTGDRHVAKYAPDGRMVVVFRDMDETSPTRGHFVAWVGTYEDLKLNRPGQYRVKLLHSYAGADCGYAGLELLPDGTFVAVTYIKERAGKQELRTDAGKISTERMYGPNEDERQSVVAVRFRLDELDQILRKYHGSVASK